MLSGTTIDVGNEIFVQTNETKAQVRRGRRKVKIFGCS
jgi:hypothetical protein